MADEIIPVPDDLVQNWPAETQNQLLAAIKDVLVRTPYLSDMQPVDCSDIVICGSRVLGGYRPTSDMDAVAYINNYTPPSLLGRSYFRHREVAKFMDVKVDVWLRCPNDKGLGIFPGHPDAPTELGWRLPYYSLITHTVEQVYPNEIESYYQFMYPLKPGIGSSDRRWDKLITDVKMPF